MASSTTQAPPLPRTTEPVPAPADDPGQGELMPIVDAAEMIGRDARTISRWIDKEQIRGNRPINPETGEPVPLSHRKVDAGHAVAYAVAAGRGHLVPERWRHLLPAAALPAQRSDASGGDRA